MEDESEREEKVSGNRSAGVVRVKKTEVKE